MTDRKKPGVAFWATVGLVVVLVGYVLSLGPAIWLAARRAPSHTRILEIYRPVAWVYGKMPRPVHQFVGKKVIGPLMPGRALVLTGEKIFFVD